MELTPLQGFSTVFFVGAMAGVAALLNSKRPLSYRNVAGAFLFSGLSGTGAAMLVARQVVDTGDPWGWYMAAGGAIVAGLGGGKALDLLRTGK